MCALNHLLLCVCVCVCVCARVLRDQDLSVLRTIK